MKVGFYARGKVKCELDDNAGALEDYSKAIDLG